MSNIKGKIVSVDKNRNRVIKKKKTVRDIVHYVHSRKRYLFTPNEIGDKFSHEITCNNNEKSCGDQQAQPDWRKFG